MDRFAFWTGYLRVVSALFALQGAYWAATGTFAPGDLYEARMARALFGTPALPAEAERTFRFLLAPLGATSAGYFLLQLTLVHHGIARRQRWAWNAVAAAFAAWFVLDTGFCLARGAAFNVWLANLPALALTAPALWGTRPEAWAAS